MGQNTDSALSMGLSSLKSLVVKNNYFTSNQADLPITGGGVPNKVMPTFCNSNGESVEIYVQATLENEVEETIISIMKDGVVVA